MNLCPWHIQRWSRAESSPNLTAHAGPLETMERHHILWGWVMIGLLEQHLKGAWSERQALPLF